MIQFKIHITLLALLLANVGLAQLSPGPLSDAHKELEGLNNCTKCHSLGNQVPDNKCLDCHEEINTLITQERGYHASSEVRNKTCVDCHSEHHGRKFDAMRFDEESFDHLLTGYELEGAHEKIDCRKCHKPDYIENPDLKNRKETFLGLEHDCLSCHDDFHQGTLDNDCAKCHGVEKFKPAEFFDHDDAEFKLVGAHRDVDCIKCHKETQRNGKKFQEFVGMPFAKCTDCHEDEHHGKFGTNCLECHNEDSWTSLSFNIAKFDHDRTDYPLTGLHQKVDCKECHKGSYTDPIDFRYCKTCHQDYHDGEFTSRNPRSDCKDCHLIEEPFTYTLYGIEEHANSQFKLEGAHLATPCFECHLDENERWTFREIGLTCIDCHENIHGKEITEEFMPENDCRHCHNSDEWTSISFDHNTTNWPLEGAHNEVSCRDCHFETLENSNEFGQKFKNLGTDCVTCHSNVHGQQFDHRGPNNCVQCHTVSKNWNVDEFDHDATEFPLDGKHREVDCAACHKDKVFEDGVERVEYKIKKFECIDCHL